MPQIAEALQPPVQVVDQRTVLDRSEVLVIRPRTTLGRDPGDDLIRVLDVAGFAVHAVGCIDLQAFAVRHARVVDHFIDAGGTVDAALPRPTCLDVTDVCIVADCEVSP